MKTSNVNAKGIVLTKVTVTPSSFFEGQNNVTLHYTCLTHKVEGSRFGASTAIGLYEADVAEYEALQASYAAGKISHADFKAGMLDLADDGSIRKCEVLPYIIKGNPDAKDEQARQDRTVSTRVIVRFGDESWDDAILASGQRLPDSTEPAENTPQAEAEAQPEQVQNEPDFD